MLVVSRSRPELNIKEAIGHHEFSVVPRLPFVGNVVILPYSKRDLIKILEDQARLNGADTYQGDVETENNYIH